MTADTSGQLQLATGASATTALTIDTSQNVGVGTTSPASFSGKLVINTGTNKNISLRGSIRLAGSSIQSIQSDAATDSPLEIFCNSAQLQLEGTPVTFLASGTERMRIDSSGNMLVGVSSIPFNTAKLFVGTAATRGCYLYSTSAGDVGTEQLRIGKYDNNTTTSQIFVRFTVNNDSNGSGQINANGASSAAFGSYSDISLKENIEPLPSQLNNIMALKPSEFDYKDGSGHQIGFIAQDMQEVYPDVVSPDENGLLMVTGWSKTEARLVKAIQEQQTIINDLKARIETLEGVK